MKKRIIEAVIAATVSLVVFVSCGRAQVSVDSEGSLSPETLEEADTGQELKSSESTLKQIYVHVCGQVESPGVYSLSEGARVYEAVEMAGGPTEEAYLEGINLVEVLSDGQKVYVPTVGQEDAELTSYDDGLVNINTADVEKLCSIPGIGQTRAQAIVNYRQEYGRFETIEELMNVSGIKEGTFEKIKDYIKV